MKQWVVPFGIIIMQFCANLSNSFTKCVQSSPMATQIKHLLVMFLGTLNGDLDPVFRVISIVTHHQCSLNQANILIKA